ncbi:MAG: S-layer homology domain-containing protein [Sedimentibacter sp.]
MRRMKKTIAVILCLIMALGSFAFADVKDYEGHWAQATIQKWMDSGKVSGYPDGSYKPDANVTRAEFVKLVNGIIDFNKKADLTFKDVPATEWYYDYVGVAQEIGYISGYSAEKFGPNDYITREQAASILSRIQYLANNEEAAGKFTDSSDMSSWAKGSVGAASEAGFISGYTDGSLKPLNNLTRAEALTMIDNVMVNGKNVVVYNAGAELKDFVVEGDLIIAKTVGDGDVHLTNVEVKGNLYVYGGGENSLYFNNLKVAKIVVEKDKVRLVLGEGTTVQEVEITTEVKLENTDGTVAKVTLTGDKEVTLTGTFKDVAVVANSNIVLNNAKVETIVAAKPIVIKGTGTVTTLNANSNGITFEAKVEITKTVTGTGVTEKPAQVETPPAGGGGGGGTGGGDGDTTKEYKIDFSIALENGEDNSNIPFVPTISFKETEIMSDIFEGLIPQTKTIMNSASVKTEVEKLLASYNSRIVNADTIKLGSKVIYTKADGWNDNAYSYLNGTALKTHLSSEYPGLLDKIALDINDINDLLDAYAAVYSNPNTVKDDLTKIKTTLENEFNEDSTKAITYTYGSTVKEFNMNFDAANNTKDKSGINQIDELVDFINANYANSYTTLASFVNTYGNKIVITTTLGDDTTGTFTINITEK